MSARTSPGRSARSLATSRRERGCPQSSLPPLEGEGRERARGAGVVHPPTTLTRPPRAHAVDPPQRGRGRASHGRSPIRTRLRIRPAPEKILSVNNIEVLYDHVILVLKGVSLDVDKGGIVALLGANGAGKTTTLKAISNLLHSERGEVTKGSIVFEGARGAGAVAERTGAARLHPGDGGPALLRPSHHRGESADRRVHPQGRPRRDRAATSNWSTAISRG